MIKAKNALIMIDLQNDFCAGGRLAVPQGDEVISVANQLQPVFDIVIATADWHPRDHLSFAENHAGGVVGSVIMMQGAPQVLWPVHCVQQSVGAQFHPALDQGQIQKIIYKGTDKTIDSYSAFFDNAHAKSTELAAYLQALALKKIYMLGLATDYCVQYSVLDALQLGLQVTVITDGCRGVELNPGDVAQAWQAMKQAGARLVTAAEVKHELSGK